MGHIGSGKTSVCAGLTGGLARFNEGHTLTLDSKDEEWIREGTQYKITIVDAPGFNGPFSLADLAIPEHIKANHKCVTSLFLCLSHTKLMGEAELRGVRALLGRLKAAHLTEFTTVLITDAETLRASGHEEQHQFMARMASLDLPSGGRAELVYPCHEQYQSDNPLKPMHEERVKIYRTRLWRSICEPFGKEGLPWAKLERFVDEENTLQRTLAQLQHATPQEISQAITAIEGEKPGRR